MAIAILDYAAWQETDGKDGNYLVLDEIFTSDYDTFVNLDETYIGGEMVTTTDGLTTYINGTDYEMDYTNGQIKVLSTGSMADATNYHIDYNFDETKEYDDTQGAENFINNFVATNTTAWNKNGTYVSPEYDVSSIGEVGRSNITYSLTPTNCTFEIQTRYSDNSWETKSSGDNLVPVGVTGTTVQYRIIITTTDQESATRPQIDGNVLIILQEFAEIIANGNINTSPTITATFDVAATYIEIARESGGESMRFEHAFNVADELIIDMNNMTAKLNGSNALIYLTAGDFFDFVPEQEHEMIIDSDGSLTIEVSYKPRWI